MKLLGNMTINNQELAIAGHGARELVEKYGSPLYVIDQEDLLARIQTFVTNFVSDQFKTNVIYASKAFTNLYMAQLVSKQGLSMDVVSGGELYTAVEA